MRHIWKFTAMIINFFSFIYNCSSNMDYFIYTSHPEHNKIKIHLGESEEAFEFSVQETGAERSFVKRQTH